MDYGAGFAVHARKVRSVRLSALDALPAQHAQILCAHVLLSNCATRATALPSEAGGRRASLPRALEHVQNEAAPAPRACVLCDREGKERYMVLSISMSSLESSLSKSNIINSRSCNLPTPLI